MKCDRCQSFLSDYVDGILKETDQREVEAHLKICADCERELRAEQRLRKMLSSCAKTPVPENSVSRIVAVAHQSPPLQPMTCDEVLPLVSLYIDEELRDVDSRCVLNHVAVCHHCYTELVTFERQSVLVNRLPGMRAPLALKEAIMQRVTQQPQGWLAGVFSRAHAVLAWQPKWSYGFVAATAAMLGAMWISQTVPTGITEEPSMKSQPAPSLVAANPPKKQTPDEVKPPAASSVDVAVPAASEGNLQASPNAMPLALPVNVPPLPSIPAVNVPQTKIKPSSSAKTSKPKPTNAAENALAGLDKSVMKPAVSEDFNLPDAVPAASEEKMDAVKSGEMGGTSGDDDVVLVSAPTTQPYASELSFPDADENADAQNAATVSASRKIQLNAPPLQLPKGGVDKSQFMRGQRIDGLPRRAVIAKSGI